VDVAPLAPLDEAQKTALLARITEAGGVFFTGGDQARIMDVLRDEVLLRAFRARYRAGAVFGGTSAGTAIMSPRMITGEGDFTVIDAAQVETRPGLGLLEGTIVDQHFVKRQRENRLFGLILAHPELLGVGIDEGSALVVRDGRFGEVVGSTPVMLVDGARDKGALVVRLARPGQTIDLRERRVRFRGFVTASRLLLQRLQGILGGALHVLVRVLLRGFEKRLRGGVADPSESIGGGLADRSIGVLQ